MPVGLQFHTAVAFDMIVGASSLFVQATSRMTAKFFKPFHKTNRFVKLSSTAIEKVSSTEMKEFRQHCGFVQLSGNLRLPVSFQGFYGQL